MDKANTKFDTCIHVNIGNLFACLILPALGSYNAYAYGYMTECRLCFVHRHVVHEKKSRIKYMKQGMKAYS